MHNRIALLFVSLCLIAFAAHSQISLSPYSHYGLGDVFTTAGTRNFGMGQVGIAVHDVASINRLNPASYADMRLTTFDFNGLVAYGSQKSNLNAQNLGTAAFHNASFGFSNRKGFGIVAGLAPYTTLGYDVRTRDSIRVDTAFEKFTSKYTGSGGLNQLYFGFGIRFLHKIQAGLNLAYAFGTNQYEWNTLWDNSTILPGTTEKRATIKGMAPQFGVQYGDTIKVKMTVDRIKEIEKLQKELDDQITEMEKEKLELTKETAKIDTWEVEKQAEIDEMVAENERLITAIKNLMVNERENSKEIGKLQDHSYRLEKKRKELVQEIKARRKENTDALAHIDVRIEKTKQRKVMLDQEKNDIQLGKKDNTQTRTQRYMVRFGGTWDPGINLKGTQTIRFTNTGIVDTLRVDTGKVRLPSKIGLGISFSRPNKWMIAVDATLQNWSKFSYFKESNTFQSAIGLNVGGEWIPEIGSPKLGKKIAYRIGGYYKQTYLSIRGQQINEIGLTAGVGIPIGYYNPFGPSYSRINMGVSLSRRGTMAANLLQEMTIQFRLGVNINDIWFIKRRVD